MFKARPRIASPVESSTLSRSDSAYTPDSDRRHEWIAWKAERGQQSIVCRVTERRRNHFVIVVLANGELLHRQGVDDLRPPHVGRVDAATDELQARFLEPFIAACLEPFPSESRTVRDRAPETGLSLVASPHPVNARPQ